MRMAATWLGESSEAEPRYICELEGNGVGKERGFALEGSGDSEKEGKVLQCGDCTSLTRTGDS